MFYNILFDSFNKYNQKNNIKIILFTSLIFGIFALLYGSIQENIIQSTSIFILTISSIFVYFYFKKKYNHKFKKLRRKAYKKDVLGLLCNESNKDLYVCQQYKKATLNYHYIKNLLLQNYDYIS